ncbi:MAG: hypothetical protein M3347_13385 [Armatimonadota bacterium]|nr:hypothetical protein [Armatimonadota bacterium]
MTLILEVPPGMERVLEEKARHAGLTPQAYVLDVLARDIGADADDEDARREDMRARWATFLKLAEELRPRIEAGTLRPIEPNEITRYIHEAREERDREIEAAAGGYGTNDDGA